MENQKENQEETGVVEAVALTPIEAVVFCDIKNYLLRRRRFDRAFSFLHVLAYDPDLDSHLKHADIRTRRRLINRHDKLHALTAAWNALRIFDILFFEAETDQQTIANGLSEITACRNNYPELRDCRDEDVLESIALTLVISAYCHDIGRPFIENHPARSFENSKQVVDYILNNRFRNQDTRVFFRNLIADCITKHEARSVDKQECIEEGIVTVADCLDNAKDRIVAEESEAQALLLDPDPIEFFSCRDIDKIVLRKGHGKPILITYRLSGYAGTYQLTIMKRKLQNTKLCSMAKIRVYLPGNTSHSIRFFPSQEET